MRRKIRWTSAFTTFVLVVVISMALRANGQDSKTPYPSIASLEQYLMERNAEIALARTAAPKSISGDAEVMVLGRHGYETAVKNLASRQPITRRYHDTVADPSLVVDGVLAGFGLYLPVRAARRGLLPASCHPRRAFLNLRSVLGDDAGVR